MNKVISRFNSKIRKTNGCWFWVGTVLSNGYGQFYVDGKKELAHRFSYKHFKGEIKNDLCVDHVCKNRNCVNPECLRLVTRAENTLNNSEGITAKNKNKTHCIRGHKFTEDNIYYSKLPNGGRGRHCKKCAFMHRRKNKQNCHTNGI